MKSRTIRVHGEIQRLLTKSPPLTADEIAEHLDLPALYIRPRVSELVKQERVINSGERGRNASGRAAARWTAA